MRSCWHPVKMAKLFSADQQGLTVVGNRTPLFATHESLGAKMVDFSGWDMPVHYGSQIEEHQAVRSNAGVFDVSHMTVVDITGKAAKAMLARLLANDINRLSRKGQAMYTAMLNEEGGVLDDLIVYGNVGGNVDDEGEDAFLMVVNCATREKDLAWINKVASDFDCTIREQPDLGILAVQGPGAIEKARPLLPGSDALAGLKPFQGAWVEGWFIARTGYTGEQGYEIILPGDAAAGFFRQLLDAGVRPIGLGARDTLRLEAGMNLYGSDMDESVSPLEANMASTVVLEGRDFIGAKAVATQLEAGGYRQLTGLVMTERGILRAHYPVLRGNEQVGEITSGAFSPTLQHSIALARLAGDVKPGEQLAVDIRGSSKPVKVVHPPFVRNGKKVFE